MTIHLKPAETPITEDDAFIAAALKEASTPTLMMAMIHMTGDASLLDGPDRPVTPMVGEVQGMLSPEAQDRIRAQALEVIKAYRDRGCTLPPPPDAQTLHRMINFVIGSPVGDEYVPMLEEEMALDGIDHRAFTWERTVPEAVRASYPVVVIGAGMSGLLMGIRLAEAGLPFTLIEKDEEVGGTWFENRYPGCRVDSPNHFYSYSFEPNHDWPEFFSRRNELKGYFERVTDRFRLREHIRFATEVVRCDWDAAANLWRVRVRAKDGTEEVLNAAAVVSAVGQLNRPRLPDIKGRETFKGPSFHTAQWESQHDLNGKRIAVVGSGASALQAVPELAKGASKLTLFMRSAPWTSYNRLYHETVGEGKKWLLKHIPYYARWYRFLLFYPGSDGMLPRLVGDPAWNDQTHSVSQNNENFRQFLLGQIKEHLGDRPDLMEKATPDYPAGIKRLLVDNGNWYRTLKRDNVETITDGIREIVEDGVIDATGRHHPVDAIIYATGFYANKFLWPMEFTGEGGVNLREMWGDEPRAHLGITVPEFPNLFLLYGPSTDLAHGGSIIFHSECQVRYVMGCLKAMVEGGHKRMAVKREAFDGYVDRLQKECLRMVWSHPGSRSWYKNDRGVVINTSPWRLIDYWAWTKAPDLSEYRLA